MKFISFIFQDSVTCGLKPSVVSLLKVPFCNTSYKIVVYFRILQYFQQKNTLSVFQKILRIRYSYLCDSLNVTLYPETKIGRGLCFPHAYPIVINPSSTIGDNCIIHPCVLIGRDRGKKGAPVIGDNCFLGHGAKIIGNPRIGDWCFIAPGAIITKNIPSGSLVGSGLNMIMNSEGKKHVLMYRKS